MDDGNLFRRLVFSFFFSLNGLFAGKKTRSLFAVVLFGSSALGMELRALTHGGADRLVLGKKR